jgi:hypothetical protein
MQNLRFLLLPITSFIWFLASYYSVFLILTAFFWFFSLEWYFFYLGWMLFIGATYFIAIGLPSAFLALASYLYKLNKFSGLIHCISGLAGVFLIYYHFYNNPPMAFNGNEEVFVFKYMWEESWFRTISLILPLIGFLLAHFYSFAISPILACYEDV